MGSIPVEGNFFYKLAEAVLYAPPSPLSVVLIFGEGGGDLLHLFLFRGEMGGSGPSGGIFCGGGLYGGCFDFLGGMEFRHEGVQLGRCDLAHGRQRYLQRQ